MINKKNLWLVAKIFGVIALLWIFFWLVFPVLTSDELSLFVERAKGWGPAVIIVYIVISHIVAPLAGIPAFLVGVPLFGIFKTILYIYVASMISAVINFYIARLLGRRWVERFAGRKTMEKIDAFVHTAGGGILTSARIFGIAVFEETSYAAGLTNISFKRYMAITVLVSIIPHGALIYFFRNTDFSSPTNTGLLLGVLILVGAVFGFFLTKYTMWAHKKSHLKDTQSSLARPTQ